MSQMQNRVNNRFPQMLMLSAPKTEAVTVFQQGSCAHHRALPDKNSTAMLPVMRTFLLDYGQTFHCGG